MAAELSHLWDLARPASPTTPALGWRRFAWFRERRYSAITDGMDAWRDYFYLMDGSIIPVTPDTTAAMSLGFSSLRLSWARRRVRPPRTKKTVSPANECPFPPTSVGEVA